LSHCATSCGKGDAREHRKVSRTPDLIIRIGGNGENLNSGAEKMFQLPAEPLYISDRFRVVLESTILTLESGAARDERTLPHLVDWDHRRRQWQLVAAQLERAFQLRELLAQTEARSERAA
jgi:hypothetical protein